jgi:hypothetical protein
MNFKHISLLGASLFLFLTLSVTVMAQENPAENVVDILINIATLDFLDNDDEKLAAFVRILVGIITFAVVNTVVKRFTTGGRTAVGSSNFFTGGTSTVISVVLAIMSSIFINPGLLIAIGAGYAVLTASVFVAALVVGVWYLLYVWLPSNVGSLTGRPLRLIRIISLIILAIVMSNITGALIGNFDFGGFS